MKILIITPEYLPTHGGGIITFYRHLLPEFVKQGHEVTVLVGSGAFTKSDPQPFIPDGVKVLQLDDVLFRSKLAEFDRFQALPALRTHLAAAWAIHDMAKELGPFDIVEASDWGLLFVPWVIDSNTPTVVQLHGSGGQIDQRDPVAGEEVQGALIRLMEVAGLREATAPQAYSQQNANFWAGQTGKSVAVIRPAWRPFSTKTDGLVRKERGLVVGRVQHWKGPQILCKALGLFGRDSPEIDWIGRDTSFGSRSQKMTDHLTKRFPGIWGTRILNLQPLSPEEIASCMATAAFTVVPSLWDTFNFTCVESMGMATPTICSNGAGASELIQDSVNGFVFESGNAQSLAAAIERFQALDSNARQRLGEAGRETVLRELDPKRIATQRLAGYESAIESKDQRPLQDGDWLRLACSPGEFVVTESLAFLDHLPLKSLMSYSLKRTIRKLSRH